jgi:hypothetical protein
VWRAWIGGSAGGDVLGIVILLGERGRQAVCPVPPLVRTYVRTYLRVRTYVRTVELAIDAYVLKYQAL